MYTLTLKKKEEIRLLEGHPWVYANEVYQISGYGEQGSIARVESFDHRFIGYGYINHASKIIVRLLTRDETPIDRDFFKNRIIQANERKIQLGYQDAYRVVFGESDFLPALIVDKYQDYLSVQFLSLGMEVRKQMIIEILIELFAPLGIYERSDVPVREKEGLAQQKGILYGAVPDEIIIQENGLQICIDIKEGQKTGYFLDQKENRDHLRHFVRGKKVLDCFSNIGGFSLCASKYQAKEVISLDSSIRAIETVNKNAALNGFSNIQAIPCDVFEQFRIYRKQKEMFDVIILDPPAFIKSKDKVKEGYRGYKDLNIQAMKCMNKNGYLITCSCSQHLTLPLFMQMIKESALEAGVEVKLVEFRTQARDHATLLALEESLYLKVAILQIC
ncbi:MAG: class I SAM-dependent rRNA methyltransferase [Bacilli bacterium]|jgi:23S rRNA (cytosine1962-C5)-methyltransferase|nr:class I SAM-dependent rRNA methyltransferase [Bacilli bacterium]MDY0064239.1 class I SAM-dependent rRNA methyltransferase [Bacilli bacterium]